MKFMITLRLLHARDTANTMSYTVDVYSSSTQAFCVSCAFKGYKFIILYTKTTLLNCKIRGFFANYCKNVSVIYNTKQCNVITRIGVGGELIRTRNIKQGFWVLILEASYTKSGVFLSLLY